MWLYKNIKINSLLELFEANIINKEPYGFIYIIKNRTKDKFYIGKKNLYSVQNKQLGKKEISQLVDKRASKKKKIIKESNWLTYFGSNKQLNDDIKNGDIIEKEILHVCYNKKQLTYYEMYYQILCNVLEDDSSYNDNIIGKFFKKDLI